MTRFAPKILFAAALTLGFVPAFAQDDAPSGVDLLRQAMTETRSDAARGQKIRAALPVLRRDAIAGNAQAQYNLARLYETGVAVEAEGEGATLTFPARAYAWYVAAARQDHPQAIKRLAVTGSTAFGLEAPQSTPAAVEKTDTGITLSTGYQLKVASFRDAANAAALVEQLAAEGISALAHRRLDGAGVEWHVVESAPLFDKAEAEALVVTLKQDFGADAEIHVISAMSNAGSPSQ